MSTTLSPVIPFAQLRIDTTCLSPVFVRVAVTGEIHLATAGMLHDGLRTALSAPHLHRVEIDLAGVSFMDCTGLTVLLVARHAALRTGCQLRITNPQPIVRHLLNLTRLLGVLTAPFDRAPLMPAGSASTSQVEPIPATVTRPAGSRSTGLLVAA
jgi:anti-anti-sigma factor